MSMPSWFRWNPARWGAATRKAVLAAMAVVAIVAGWRLVVYVRGGELRRIGRELVAVNLLVKQPVPNRAGDKILFAQSTEQGVALYLFDCQTGQRQTVYELPERRIVSGSLVLLEWAPDDTMLAYAKPAKGKKQEVVLCSSFTGTKVGSVPVVGSIEEFRWLSPASFAYLNNSNQLYVATRGSEAKWTQVQRYASTAKEPPSHLEAVSPTELTWQHARGSVWKLDLAASAPERLWKPATNRLSSAYFAPEQKKLIVRTMTQDKSHEILRLDPWTRQVEVLDTLAERAIGKVYGLGSGKGFAYQCTDHWGDSLLLRGISRDEIKLFSDGEVVDYRVRGDKVFICGSRTNEPPGIWRYDVSSGTLTCLVASTDQPFSVGALVQHTSDTLTNGTRLLTYQRWAPAKREKGRRYPLILGQTTYRWGPYPFMAVAAGYEFIIVNRKSWWEGIDKWEEDVLLAHAEFTRKAEIDPKRVYLYGHSAETGPISNLAASRPELWRGAFVLSPTALPDLAQCRLSSMLIDTAELDDLAGRRVVDYQAQAAQRGVVVRLVVHPNARHTSWSRATELDKVSNLAAFLTSQ